MWCGTCPVGSGESRPPRCSLGGSGGWSRPLLGSCAAPTSQGAGLMGWKLVDPPRVALRARIGQHSAARSTVRNHRCTLHHQLNPHPCVRTSVLQTAAGRPATSRGQLVPSGAMRASLPPARLAAQSAESVAHHISPSSLCGRWAVGSCRAPPTEVVTSTRPNRRRSRARGSGAARSPGLRSPAGPGRTGPWPQWAYAAPRYARGTGSHDSSSSGSNSTSHATASRTGVVGRPGDRRYCRRRSAPSYLRAAFPATRRRSSDRRPRASKNSCYCLYHRPPREAWCWLVVDVRHPNRLVR